jgi:copper(I)-binding protein
MGERGLVRLGLLAVALLLAACGRRSGGVTLGTSGVIDVPRGFAYEPTGSAQMAAYFTVRNHGGTADTLEGVRSPLAAHAMVHAQRLEGGMMKMEHAGPLAIPPGDSLVLAPGGLHVMLELSAGGPAQGDSLPLTLSFRHSGDVSVTLPVRAYGDEP